MRRVIDLSENFFKKQKTVIIVAERVMVLCLFNSWPVEYVKSWHFD